MQLDLLLVAVIRFAVSMTSLICRP